MAAWGGEKTGKGRSKGGKSWFRRILRWEIRKNRRTGVVVCWASTWGSSRKAEDKGASL